MKISELPKYERELALLRQQEEKDENIFSKTEDNLEEAFYWRNTEEGNDFWEHWDNKEVDAIPIKTEKEQITDMIQKKIDIMEMRKFPNYNLAIGILKDLIREIK
jgi:hypothetical protein